MNNTERRSRGKPFCRKSTASRILQTPHTEELFSQGQLNGKRASLCPFLKGSLTLEAACVLPVFLYAVMALLYLFTFAGQQSLECRRLTERAQMLAVTAGQAVRTDPYIRLYDYGRIRPPVPELFSSGHSVVRKASVRAWIGYTGETFSGGAAEKMVYRTLEGKVYHLTLECTYLTLTIRPLSASEIEEARNLSGARYNPCESCMRNVDLPGRVYITDYGTSYHSTAKCQGLKRTVMAIPLSEAAGMHSCSKCGGI